MSEVEPGCKPEANENLPTNLSNEDYTFAGIFFAQHNIYDPYAYNTWDKIRSEVPVAISTSSSNKIDVVNSRISSKMLNAQTMDVDAISKRQGVINALLDTDDLGGLSLACEDAGELSSSLFKLFQRFHFYQDGFGATFQLYDAYDLGYDKLQISDDLNPFSEDLDHGRYGYKRSFMQDDNDPIHDFITDGLIDIPLVTKFYFEKAARGIDSLDTLANMLNTVDHPDVQETAQRFAELTKALSEIFISDHILHREDSDVNLLEIQNIGGENDFGGFGKKTGDHFECVLAELPFHESMPSRDPEKPRYYYESCHGGKDFAWALALKERIDDIASVTAIAKHIKDQNWQQVDFDQTKPDTYTNGRHAMKERQALTANDGPDHTPTTVLSSANGTGKTHYMESDLYIRLLGQSIGFAPAEQANLWPHDSFHFLGRVASSTALHGRGAFEEEISRWIAALDGGGQKPYWYVDEGASTTSPAEQAVLLVALTQYLTKIGGRLMHATHNELVADLVNKLNLGSSYYFNSTIDDSGRLQSDHLLRPGTDDSKFFALAKALNFPAGLVEQMRARLTGAKVGLGEKRTIDYPELIRYTKEERLERIAQEGGLSYVFPVDPKETNPQFVLFGNNRKILHTGLGPEIDNALFLSKPITSQELLGRQDTLRKLLRDSTYSELLTCCSQLENIEFHIQIVEKALSKGLLPTLNPLNDLDRSHQTYIDPAKALAWAELYNLLGNEKAIDLSALKPLSDARNEHRRLSKNLTALETEKEDIQNQLASDQEARTQKSESIWAVESKIQVTREELYAVRTAALEAFTNMHSRLYSSTPPVLDLTTCHNNSKIAEKIAVLAANSSGSIRKNNKDPNDQLSIELLGAINPSKATASAIIKIAVADKAAERLGSFAGGLDSVHVHQGARYATSIYSRLRRKLSVEQRKDAEQLDSAAQQTTNMYRSLPTNNVDLAINAQQSARDAQLEAVLANMQADNGELNKELDRLAAFGSLAKHIADNNYAEVIFNTSGKVQLEDLRPITTPQRGATPNTLSLEQSKNIGLLTSPHGSGKTFYQQTAVVAAALAQNFGFAPASFATMPILDRIAYVERISQGQNATLSAGMQELEYWKQAMGALDTPGSVLIAADEVGSSTSPKYQSAFVKTVVDEVSRLGHYMLVSTHNHEAAQKLVQESHVEALRLEVTEVDGKRSHSLQKGLGQSDALKIAEERGLPEEIVLSAKNILASL